MYCPNCGKESSGEQKFCRSCGLKLQTISQVMARELSEADPTQIDERAGQHRPQKLGSQPLLLWGFLIMMLGLLLGVVGKKILSVESMAGIGAVIAILGVGFIGYWAVRLIAPAARVAPEPTLPAPVDLSTDRQLSAPPASVPSVTENTTRQLEPASEESASDARRG